MYRFVTPVVPSEDDDVITSPYNALFSLEQMSNYADCVLPVENQALFDIAQRLGCVAYRCIDAAPFI